MSAGPRTRAARPSAAVLGQAASHIGERDRWLIRMLHEHTVLTTPQLTVLGFGPSPRATQMRLARLHQLGVLDRFQPLRQHTNGSLPIHHVLGPLGAAILAAEIGVEVTALGWRRERVAAVAHRLSLAHDTATTDLVCELATAAGVHLDAWWSPTRCRRVVGRHVRPDTYLSLTTTALSTTSTTPDTTTWAGGPGGPDRVWEMFVEYDTGTTALRALAAKLHHYHQRAAAARTVIPVGFWIARPGREPGARRALTAVHRILPDPARVPVFTATPPATATDTDTWSGAVERLGYGIGAPVWLALHHRAGQMPRRYRLTELARHRPTGRLTLAETTDADPDGYSADGYAGAPDAVGGRVELPAPSPYPPRPPARLHAAAARRRTTGGPS